MLKRLFAIAAITVISVTGLAATPAFADAANTDPTAVVLAQINAYRQQNGSPLLVAQDPRLVDIAQDWAQTLQADPVQVMYHNPNVWAEMQPATEGGEVVSQYYSPGMVATKWYQSSTHRGILLSKNWNAVGIGYVYDAVTGYYWIVADFAYYPTTADTATASFGKMASPTFSTIDTTAMVSWQPVSGAQGYDLTLYNAAGSKLDERFVTGSTNYVYNNLARGQGYYATIAAYGSNGVGAVSDPSVPATIEALAPDAVPDGNVSVLRSGTNALHASWWAAEADNGSPVTSYTLNLYMDGTLYRTDQTGDATNLAWNYSGLPTGHTYKAGVIANNAIGASPETISSGNGATLPDIVIPTPVASVSTPEPIVSPVATPTPSSAPAPVASIPVVIPTPVATPAPVVIPAPQPVVQPVPSAPIVTPAPVTTNTPSPTAPVATTPSPTVKAPQPHVPATVDSPSLSRVNDTTLRATWHKPSGTITGYHVTLLNGANKTVRKIDVRNATTATFTKIPAGNGYRIRVAAFNAAGSAATSGNSKSVSLVNKKAAPAKAKVHVTKSAKRKITLKWQKPGTNNGAAISRYTIRLDQGKWHKTYSLGVSVKQKTVQAPRVATVKVTFTVHNSANKHTSTVNRSGVRR